VNSYLIRGEEPTVIDTGITPEVPEFDVALRGLIAVRPPTFDNPGTLAFFDPKQNTLFSADCFGAPFTTAEAALVEDVAAVHEEELTPAQLLWGSVDSPWAHFVEEARLADNLNRFLRDKPDTVLSTHLPPIHGDLDRHVKTLAKLPSSTPHVTADRAALEAFMATMAPQ
jgi:flavorubredoxin